MDKRRVLSERDRKLVSNLKDGKAVLPAMVDAGFPVSQARKGKAALSRRVVLALAAQGQEMAEVGKGLTAEHVEHAIAGKAYLSMVTGDSKGLEGAKLLGSMAKYNLFASEQQAAVLIVSAPTDWLTLAQVPKPEPKQLEAEVISTDNPK